MNTISIETAALIAGNIVASKDRGRPFINTVHLSPCGAVAATDGHSLLHWADAVKNPPSEPINLTLGSRANLNWKSKICVYQVDNCQIVSNEPNGDTLRLAVSKSDFDYPNWKAVIPDTNPEPLDNIGINMTKFGIANRVFKEKVFLTFYGNNAPFSVKPMEGKSKAVLWVMPSKPAI